MPFNQSSYRKINKLKLLGTIPKIDQYSKYYKDLGKPIGVPTVIFEANTASGFSFDAATKQQASLFGLDNNLLTLAFNALGKAPALDYPRKFTYTGTEPLKWSVDCYLVLENPESVSGSIEDVINRNINHPIKRLMGLYLPTPEEESVQGTIKNLVSSISDSWIGKNIVNALEFTESLLGDVFTLNVPFPYLPFGKAENHLIFKLGGIRIEGVVVTGLRIKVPPFLYENGLPDHVDVNISFETLRPLSTKTFNGNSNLFTLK